MKSVVLCLSLLSSAAFAQQACEVVAVSGDAQRIDGKALAVGDKLDVGTTLRTGTAGRVRLKFIDGSVLVLADKSQLRIESFSAGSTKPREAELLLELGLIGQRVNPSVGGSWKVRTPTAVTAVRGTEFTVEVGDDRATAVLVKTGEVDVEPIGPQTRSVKPRYPVRLAKTNSGTRCDAKDCSDVMTWTADKVQRVEQRLGSLD
ncbi:FecR domain-containing protein [Roseateles sp.]|uniref:FecR family protein n=1 Tax=Roseateles sp. TaxID=1971397 RepID=UPI0032666257